MQQLTSLLPQIFKFILVGGMNTGIHFAVLNLLIFMTKTSEGEGLFVINAVAFIVASTNSYFLNKNWTFRDKDQDAEVVKFSTFFLVSFIGLLINSFVVFSVATFVPDFLGITYITSMLGDNTPVLWANVAALTAVGFSLVWNFIGYKFIVFKK